MSGGAGTDRAPVAPARAVPVAHHGCVTCITNVGGLAFVTLEPGARSGPHRRVCGPMSARRTTVYLSTQGFALRADELIRLLGCASYLLIFGRVLVRAVRQPTAALRDMGLFFGTASGAAVVAATVELSSPPAEAAGLAFAAALVVALPYLLLRLACHFADVPAWVLRLAELGLIGAVAGLLLAPGQRLPLAALVLAYFVAVMLYGAGAFLAEARRSRGVTRRRLEGVAWGSVYLLVAVVVSGIDVIVPSPFWRLAAYVLFVASGAAYFVGFVPPGWLRRHWQEPEVSAFLRRAAGLLRLASRERVAEELEQWGAASLGAPAAVIGLWDAAAGVLRFFHFPYPGAGGLRTTPGAELWVGALVLRDDRWELDPKADPVFGRAVLRRAAFLVPDLLHGDPGHAGLYESAGVRSALVAPVGTDEDLLGVLAIYTPRLPLFAESDLELVGMLASQAAIVLQSYSLVEEASQVRAREEVARLKDDFLAAAAHDLKTPLTSLLAQAQMLERRIERDRLGSYYRTGARRLSGTAHHLVALVQDLLEVSRAEQGRLVRDRQVADLGPLVRSLCERLDLSSHPLTVTVEGCVSASVDALRLEQLVQNLVENAAKYSAHGQPIDVRVWQDGQSARIGVADRGIGIRPEDLPHLFERYRRGVNAEAGGASGVGLGLYIAHMIVEEHGGRIWAESELGQGSTFQVALPLASPSAAEVPSACSG